MTASALSGVVLDFYLSYPDQSNSFQLPFTLTVSSTVFLVQDANGNTVLEVDSTVAYAQSWGEYRTIYEWDLATTVMRVVVTPLTNGSGVLDPRTCNRLPARVTSVTVGLIRMTGNIKLQAGYNLSLAGALPASTALTDGGRYVSVINMDAVPGAGLGRATGCDPAEIVLRTINQTQPDCSGNFNLQTDGCFRQQLPLSIDGISGEARTGQYSAIGQSTEEAQSTLVLNDDCRQCCPCEYFVRTYVGLKRVWDSWQAAATSAEATRDVYTANLARWDAAAACYAANPATLVAYTNPQCITQIGGSYCNSTQCCLTPIELRFTLQLFTDGVPVPWKGSIVQAFISGSSTQGDEAYVPLEQGPVLRFFFSYANPSALSVAKFKLMVCNCAANQSIQVTMTVHTPTNSACELPQATVPAPLAALWRANGVPATPTATVLLTTTKPVNPAPLTYPCATCEPASSESSPNSESISPPPSAPTGTAIISGQVEFYDPELEILPTPDEGDTVTLTDASNNVVATTTTDVNGDYSFGSLPAGTYTVSENDGGASSTVTVESSGTTTVNLLFIGN